MTRIAQEEDMRLKDLTVHLAQDRLKWERLIRNNNPTSMGKVVTEEKKTLVL